MAVENGTENWPGYYFILFYFILFWFLLLILLFGFWFFLFKKDKNKKCHQSDKIKIGANAIEDENGVVTRLEHHNEDRRKALAKTLKTPFSECILFSFFFFCFLHFFFFSFFCFAKDISSNLKFLFILQLKKKKKQ